MNNTPTPWKANDNLVTLANDTTAIIAQVYDPHNNKQINETVMANAAYIAKSANLFEELVAMINRYKNHCGNRGIMYMELRDQEQLYYDAERLLEKAWEQRVTRISK